MMKAFQAQIYENGVKIFTGIHLTTYEWDSPDPFIGLGWGTKIYPPKLFSRIKDRKLMEIEDSAVTLLSLSGKIKANHFSLSEPGEKLLVAWFIGDLFSLIDHLHKNIILGIGRYPTFSNGDIVTNSCYNHMAILAVLPADGGAIEASGRFFDKTNRAEYHRMMLKTLQGEVKIEF